MKYIGSHFGLLFLTSSELEPEDFLSQVSFVEKLSAIFAPWDTAVSNTEIPDEKELQALCKKADMCNILVKNFESKKLIIFHKFY